MQVTKLKQLSQSPAWTPDGQHLVFRFGPYHLGSLARIHAFHPDKLQSLPGDGVQFPVASLSRARLAYTKATADVNIWSLDLPQAGPGEGVKRQLISSTYLDHTPEYSPDTQRIAFVSNRSGYQEIWVADSKGQNAVQWTSFNGSEATLPRWAPNGRSLAFSVDHGETSDIYIMDAGATKSRRLISRGRNAAWSRDDKWLYFTSQRSGRREIWKVDAGGAGTAVPVTRNGGEAARESLDGRFLYYTKVGASISLWRMPAEGGSETTIAEDLHTPISFDVAGDRVFFIQKAGPDGRAIFRVWNGRNGELSSVGSANKPLRWGFSASPDGASLLFVQLDQSAADLMLLEDFR